MKASIERKIHTIDASGQVLGRLASKIAMILQGKNKATYVPHEDRGDIVDVKNVKDMKFTGNKMEEKEYKHFSGYPGGMKTVILKDLLAKSPEKVLWHAVHRMLPKNRLRAGMIKRLKFSK